MGKQVNALAHFVLAFMIYRQLYGKCYIYDRG